MFRPTVLQRQLLQASKTEDVFVFVCNIHSVIFNLHSIAHYAKAVGFFAVARYLVTTVSSVDS